MESVFRCPSPSQCPDDGVHYVTSLNNLKIFSKQRASNSEEVHSCSYSIYDYTQELQKTGTRIISDYFFCRSCKAVKRKELAI